MAVRDGRKAPFIWASVSAVTRLLEAWDSDRAEARAPVGLAVYVGLCLVANQDTARANMHEDSEAFKATVGEISAHAGSPSGKSVERACRELQRIGLLRIEVDAEEGRRQGRSNFYTVLEPGQASDSSTEVQGKKAVDPATEVRTSSDSSTEVQGKPQSVDRTPPNKEKEKQQKKEESEPHRQEPDFSILQAGVAAPLRQAAEAKGGVLDPQGVKRAMDAFPAVDHALAAEKFCDWHLNGNGRKAPLKGVSQAFRKWLSNEPPASVTGGGQVVPIRQEVKREPWPAEDELAATAEEAQSVWRETAKRIAASVPESTFHLWIEPIGAAGVKGGVLFLTAPDRIRAWTERRYSSLMAEALRDVDDSLERVSFAGPADEAAA